MLPLPVVYQNCTDEELLRLMGKGQNIAFDELYNRYGQKLFGYFYRMLWKNKELAEDCTQELFLKVIKNVKKFDVDRSCSTWLYSIAHNMCKNEYRKDAVRLKYQTMKHEEGTTFNDKKIDLHKFREAVHECVNELEEDKKSLFILRFKEQLSVPDIGKILQIPEGTVKSRLFYLLKELKDKLSPFKSIHLNQ